MISEISTLESVKQAFFRKRNILKKDTKEMVCYCSSDITKDETKNINKDETKYIDKDETKYIDKDETKNINKDETKDIDNNKVKFSLIEFLENNTNNNIKQQGIKLCNQLYKYVIREEGKNEIKFYTEELDFTCGKEQIKIDIKESIKLICSNNIDIVEMNQA
jgi:hypothetical protein